MGSKTQKAFPDVFVLLLAGLLIGVFTPPQACACKVPVFRYALEQWLPDAYRITIFRRGASEPVEPGIKAGKKGDPNVELRTVDLAGPLDAATEKLWKAQNNPPLPWMVVRYPEESGLGEQIAWAGALTAENVGALTNSPARWAIAQRLMRGDSAVWVLLESGNKARDDAVAAMLEAASRKMEKELELPQPDADDPKINGDVPLKVAFSTCRISRGDAAERLFVETLLHLEDDLKSQTGPMVFPVFGRGRLLSILTGKTITHDNFEQIGGFLVGPCSCQVKAQNQGVDLLIAANWDKLPTNLAVNAPDMPKLTGMEHFAATSNTDNTIATGAPAAPTPRHPVLRRNIFWAAGLMILVVAIGTLRIFWSRSRRRQ